MTSPRLHDASLYEIALNAEHPPQPLQISPTTFRSMVHGLLDLLIEQQISATLIIKMPKGDVWRAEIDRYRKSANVLQDIYSFQPYREETASESIYTAETAEIPGVLEIDPDQEIGLIGDQGLIMPIASTYANIVPLPLIPDSQLKREYFVLVLSEEFCGLVMAHRPRSSRTSRSEAMTGEFANLRTNAVLDEDLERKHPLLGICSVEPNILRSVFQGVVQALRCGLAHLGANSNLEALAQTWQELSGEIAAKPLSPRLVSYFFTKQIQQQEEVWHSSAVYRKQAEAASILRMENEELLNAIQIKNEFLKNVGQELRTPLATMKTALTLLNSSNLKPTQRQRYMDMLSQECDRQSLLITSVLDLIQLESNTDSAPTQPLRLVDVVPGVVSTYQPLAQEKGVMLAYTIPEDLPAIACSSGALRQIAINLLHNGIKFTQAGGQVWVKAKQQGDYLQIEVRDTGIGIDATEVPRIFDRFYRVRSGLVEDSGGAGLGLSIVQQLLLRFGGSITVKSKIGEGSTFNVLLPIYHP